MKILTFIIIISAIAIAGCVGQSQIVANDTPTTTTVEMSENGFSPPTVTIAEGGTVTFRSTGTKPVWPASAVHPLHRQYPEGGGCIGSFFDACNGIEPGDEWNFTFNHAGVWGYHDHLNPPHRGVVEVKEVTTENQA